MRCFNIFTITLQSVNASMQLILSIAICIQVDMRTHVLIKSLSVVICNVPRVSKNNNKKTYDIVSCHKSLMIHCPVFASQNKSQHFFQIFTKIQGNAQLSISLDNARLASDDFRVK